MKASYRSSILCSALLLCSTSGQANNGQENNVPYSMRGLQLGVSLDEFKAFNIPNDDGNVDLRSWCSNETRPSGVYLYPKSADTAVGVVTCQWFSKMPGYQFTSDHWVDLGTGKGPPVFKFINNGDGYRLFEISFFANTQYYNGIYSALAQNYGAPKEKIEPFQTRSGAMFESKTSSWTNGISSIVFKFRCREVERYCLTYSHLPLTKIYFERLEAKDSEAAAKI